MTDPTLVGVWFRIGTQILIPPLSNWVIWGNTF